MIEKEAKGLAGSDTNATAYLAELKKLQEERDSLKKLRFTIKLETFNNNSASFDMTVDELSRLQNEKVLSRDFNKLPGFDDDKGIARRLLIQRN